jgi:hypothetical protein
VCALVLTFAAGPALEYRIMYFIEPQFESKLLPSTHICSCVRTNHKGLPAVQFLRLAIIQVTLASDQKKDDISCLRLSNLVTIGL